MTPLGLLAISTVVAIGMFFIANLFFNNKIGNDFINAIVMALSLLAGLAAGFLALGLLLYLLGVFGWFAKSEPQHASNEFCRKDTVGKVTYETCITPVSPGLVPLYITPTAER